MANLLSTTNLVAAVIYVAIALVVMVELRRLAIGFPRVALVLLGYFALRAIDLLAAPDPFLGYSRSLDAATDALVIVALVLLLTHARRLARGALATVSEARLRVAEYERARHDYSVTVHAKIAGPLSVIAGAAQSLQAAGDDERAREHLTDLISESASVLRTVSAELEELRTQPRPGGAA